MMLLLPKRVGDYRGIGLVEVLWKVCASIMNNLLLSAIILHDSMHGFRQGRGTGKSTLDTKLAQQLVGL